MLKARILKVSISEAERKGFRFTMGELAKQLGMSTKTLYGYYPSKEELLNEMIDLAIDELKMKEKEILHDATLNLVEKLQKSLVLIPADFKFAQLKYLEELQRYYPKQWETLDEFIHEQWAGIFSLIDEGIATNKIRPFNKEIFIEVYIGGLYRLMEHASQNRNMISLQDTMQEMVDILMLGILNGNVNEEN
ncbi:TetR/AcrR family transcriptional regulator [Lysinibacillus sp. NPDC093216]|uniref:TetR/AcrR family transcriptional regulator n=1 Tax=Lysinibacillus sp. NPDC093216 TaxID=3390576 RepID=UPI003D01257E